MEDNQDYEKIRIQAPANVLKNLNVVSSVKVEGEGAETGSTNESGFIIDTDTYGFDFPYYVTGIIIPKGTTLFSYFPNHRIIIIPESVTSISEGAFKRCTNLTSITIPESVTSINGWAFDGCSKLKTINYTGTEEQWNAISKGTSWKSGTAVNVIYNYKPE